MALKDILQLSHDYGETREEIYTEERIRKILPILREQIAFWREYPDIFIEFMCGDNPENFQLYFYQRVFLRAAIRHRYFYATFCRAFSKSFLSMLILMTRCILFPGSHCFVTTGGKEWKPALHYCKVVKNKFFELLEHPQSFAFASKDWAISS